MWTGNLRHRGRIERPPDNLSDIDDAPDDWEVVANAVWFSRRTLSTRERESAASVRHVVTHELTCRFVRDVQPRMRVVFDTGEVYGVAHVAMDDMDGSLMMLVDQVHAQS